MKHLVFYLLLYLIKKFLKMLLDEILEVIKAFPDLQFNVRGIYLNDFGFTPIFEKAAQVLTSLARVHHPNVSLELGTAYVIRYQDTQFHPLHDDDCDLTINTCLSFRGSGGSLAFSPENQMKSDIIYHSHPLSSDLKTFDKKVMEISHSVGPSSIPSSWNPLNLQNPESIIEENKKKI